MPTIQQLPAASSVDPADEVPVSQAGVTRSVAIGAVLASTQPMIMAPTGVLLGRNSLGSGGPEPVAIGDGLILSSGTISAPAISSLPTTTTMAATDLVAISQGGTNQAITYADFLDGQTIDTAQPALPASDTDELWVAQGSSTMLRQTFAAVWSWIATKSPTYKLPVVELTSDTTLDGTVHNGRILVCSAPIILSPAFTNMGSGFTCDIINLSGGDVTFASGITTSSGASVLPTGQSAALRGVSFSGGNVVFASVFGGSAAAPSVPGQVTGLTAGNITSSSIGLSWTAPASGGTPATYTVQYRVTGGATWTTASTAISGTSYTLTGLAAATSYDLQVFAINAAGSGTPSTAISATTTAAATAVTAITWNLAPSGTYTAGSGTIGVNAHITPSTAAVQFGFSTSSSTPPTSWTAGANVNTDLWGAYVPTPATAGTWYAWCEGVDGSLPTVYPTGFQVA